MKRTFEDSDISRDRDRFLRELLREMSGTLEETIGLDAAEGFIATVGNRIGEMMNQEYCRAAGADRLDAEQVAAALVDLKRRIAGDFSVESIDKKKIVFVNRRCPFAEHVKGRTSLCMMTSNVFGRIAADNLGYARVELDKTIAKGDAGCRVIIYLEEGKNGREYFG